jgi:hypothetical protein
MELLRLHPEDLKTLAVEIAQALKPKKEDRWIKDIDEACSIAGISRPRMQQLRDEAIPRITIKKLSQRRYAYLESSLIAYRNRKSNATSRIRTI